MTKSDPIFDAVTAKGSPFEIGERGGMREFVNAPSNLNALIEAARVHGDKIFIVEGERRLTYEQVFALRDALAATLDIAPGDRVALCMKNGTDWMIGFLAILMRGGVAALINSRGAPAELAQMVEDVSAKLVIADPDRAALLRDGGYKGRIIVASSSASTCPSTELRMEGDRSKNGGGGSAPALTAPPSSLRDATSPSQVDGEDHSGDLPAAILFTSGTTGRVKGAVLSHKNLIHGIMLMQLSGVMILTSMAEKFGMTADALRGMLPQAAVLQVFPLFHISGLGSAFLSPMFAGSKIVVMPKWDADDAFRLIAEERITMFTGVPTMLWDVLNRAKLEGADLSSLTNIGTGGQALPVNLLDTMQSVCPQAFMGTGYGLTETSGSVAQAVGEDFMRNRTAAGRVLSLVDLKIDAPRGEAGEARLLEPPRRNGSCLIC
jgi:long-chain acyl-CoA synthetase